MKSKGKSNLKTNTIKCGILAVFTLLIIGSLTNCSNKTGTYRMGFYYCGLYQDGKCSIWESESISSIHKSCLTNGNYRIEGEYIVISGLFNENCPSVSEQNGRYLIEDGIRLVGPR